MMNKNQLFFFALVGGLAALTHFVVLWLAVDHFNIRPAWGNVLGFSLAFIVSFLGHYFLTFSSSQMSLRASVWRWLLSSLFGFFSNQGLFIIGLNFLSEKYYLIIWFVVTLLVTVGSFLLGKFWAFRQA